jgi:hypothetical protein
VVVEKRTCKTHGNREVVEIKYMLKLVIEGDFPGSPDQESMEISEAEYNQVWNEFFRKDNE